MVWNGQLQTPVFENYDPIFITAYEIRGNKQSYDIAHASVGSYKTILQPCVSAVWQDGTRTPLVFSWTIEPAKVKKPYLSVEGSAVLEIPFCAALTGPKINGFNKFLVETRGTAGYSVGTYTAIFSLRYGVNTVWTDGSSQPISQTWKITRKTVALPAISNLTRTYTGKSIGPDIGDYDPAFITVSGQEAITVGNYSMTISLVDPDSVLWQDRTSESKTFSWEILRKTINPPNYSQTTFAYDGLAHEIAFSDYDPAWVKIEGMERVDIGMSYYKISLTDINTVWSDTLNRGDKIVPLEVTKKLIPIPTVTSQVSFVYDGSPKRISVNGSDGENTFSLTALDNQEVFQNKWLRISGLTGINAGNYTLRFELLDQMNTCWPNWNVDPIEISWTITKIEHLEPQAYTEYEYGGHEITCDFVFYDQKVMKVSGNKATVPGTYNAVFTLLDPDNHCWYTTKSSKPLTVPWKINKKPIDPDSLPFCDFYRYYDGEYHTFFDDFPDYNPNMFTVSNNRKVKDVGLYSVSLYIKDTDLYRWKNATTFATAPVTFSWSINKRKIHIPTLTEDTFRYEGKTINLTKQDISFAEEEDKKFITIVTGNIGVSVNTYRLTLSFGSHAGQCEWVEKPTAVSVQLPWYITKAILPTWTLLRYSVDISMAPGNYQDIIVRRAGNGEVTARSLNESVATVTVLFAYAEQPYVRVYSQGNVGTTQVEISVREGDDYLSSAESYQKEPMKTRALYLCDVTVFAS